jgi:hypothetical protein
MKATTKGNTLHGSAEPETMLVSSARAPQEILDALAAPNSSESRLKFEINVTGKRFIIARKQLVRNPFSKSMFGVVNESQIGTAVDYTFSVKPAVKILFGIWFSLMSAVLLTGVGVIIYSGVSSYRVELVALALTFLAGASSFVGICSAFSRKDEREMEKLLREIVSDAIAEKQRSH